jgi:hypothetical protein
VLHLVDRLLLLVLLELLQSPVAEHAGVEEVLVDRGELVQKHLVQVLDDLPVALHAAKASGSERVSSRISFATGRHLPQPVPTPSSTDNSSSEQQPRRAHSRTSRSVMALQIQMYI